jgi:glutamate dehydrogenase
LLKLMPGILSPIEQAAVDARVRQLTEAGAPTDKARAVAVLQPMTIAGDLVDLAEASSWPLANVARLYHAVGEAFGFDRVRQAAGAYSVGDNFERTALRRLIEDLLTQQSDLTRGIMAFAGSAQAGEDPRHAMDAASAWTALRFDKVDVARRTIDEIEASGGPWTFAKLTIANAALRELAAEGGKRRR